MNKDLNFEYIEELVDYVIDEVECDEDKFVVVIAKFDEAKEILKNAMLYEYINFDFLEIESPIMDNYADEFVLSFWINDDIIEIGCGKLKDEDGSYTTPCGDTTYLLSNCSSKIIPLCDGSDLYFVNIEDECEEDCDCDGCCCGDKPYVLSVDLNLDADEVEKIIRKCRNDFYKEVEKLLDF